MQGTYKVSECGIRPQYTLRRDAFARLAHVHRNGCAEEVLHVVRVCIGRDPAGPARGDTAKNEGGDVEEADAIEVSGETGYA